MKKKTKGWVRQANNSGNFVLENGDETKVLGKAFVYSNRYGARYSFNPARLKGIDIPKCVSLSCRGRAVAILPGR